jgi:hypothetical protein
MQHLLYYASAEAMLEAMRGDEVDRYMITWKWLYRERLAMVRAVLFPFAAMVIQAVYRRHLHRVRAILTIQSAALNFLWKPGGWAFTRGRDAVDCF